MRAPPLPGLELLVKSLNAIGAAEIGARDPATAAFIQSELATHTADELIDLFRVGILAASKGGTPAWHRCLTAALDVSMTARDVGLAVSLLASHRASDTSTDTAYLHYHYRHWATAAHAFCEKSGILFREVYRSLLSSASPAWSTKFTDAKTVARDLEKRLGKIRNGFAHERGGGVGAIEDLGLWDVFALLNMHFDYILDGQDQEIDTRRANWAGQLLGFTAEMFAAIDEQFATCAAACTVSS